MPRNEEATEAFRVKRGRVDSISLYEVTEDELRDLETGGQDSQFLTFAVAFFTMAVSFLIALLTTDIKSTKTYTIFIVVTAVGFAGSGILALFWYRSRKSRQIVIQRIKDRMPNENGVDSDADNADAVDRKSN